MKYVCINIFKWQRLSIHPFKTNINCNTYYKTQLQKFKTGYNFHIYFTLFNPNAERSQFIITQLSVKIQNIRSLIEVSIY